MFKVLVVAGPLRGNSYSIQDGETVLGRAEDCQIQLQSTKVSKRHCKISVEGNVIHVQDLGSSNGTFVNGVLTGTKKVASGDRISLGEYVLEIVKPVIEQTSSRKIPDRVQRNVIPMQRPLPMGMTSQHQGGQSMLMPGGMGVSSMSGGMLPGSTGVPSVGGSSGVVSATGSAKSDEPKDIVEKAKFYFEKYVINFIYNLNEKHEWNQILKGLLGILVLFSVFVSVYPTMDKAQTVLLAQARFRAQALARLVVEKNLTAILERAESKLDLSFAEREPGVRAVYIVDISNRIMAPGKLLNQVLESGPHGRLANSARAVFLKNPNRNSFSIPTWREDGSIDDTISWLSDSLMGYAEPIKVVNPEKQTYEVIAMALVFTDMSSILFSIEDHLLMFSWALVLAAIMAVAVYTSIYRITLKPIDQLNTNLDQVMRGEMVTLEPKGKMEELKPLYEILNQLVQKSQHAGGTQTGTSESPQDAMAPYVALAKQNLYPSLVFDGDKKILALSESMSEISGMREGEALGQDISQAARDEAFVLMVNDLLSRAPVGSSEALEDQMEFSGVNYKILAMGIGSSVGATKGWVLALRSAG